MTAIQDNTTTMTDNTTTPSLMEEDDSTPITETTNPPIPVDNIIRMSKIQLGMIKVYLGDSESRRYVPAVQYKSEQDYWLPLVDWKHHPEIAIDGMSGTGKSSLVNSLIRQSVKINQFSPITTRGPFYNIDPVRMIDYAITHVSVRGRNLVWDRCPFSNIIYGMAHHLYGLYVSWNMSVPVNFESVVSTLNNFADQIGLVNTVSYINSKKVTPTIILVNSDLKLLTTLLLNRAKPVDIRNAEEYNYQMAQLHAFTYFGRYLTKSMFLVDLGNLPLKVKNLAAVQSVIAGLVDVPYNSEILPPTYVKDDSVSTFLNHIFNIPSSSTSLLCYKTSNK